MLLLALVDNLLEAYKKYILTFENAYDQFIEFVIRYCIFRNILLDLEVYLYWFRKNLGFSPSSSKVFFRKDFRPKGKDSLIYGKSYCPNGIAPWANFINPTLKFSSSCWTKWEPKIFKRTYLGYLMRGPTLWCTHDEI